jgi:hypothetical protein
LASHFLFLCVSMSATMLTLIESFTGKSITR